MSVLGRDPAPGDPGAVRVVAARLRQRGDALLAEADGLSSLTPAQWEGAAAASFTALAVTLPDDLRRSAGAAAGAAAALEGYADALASAQGLLPALRARAEEASRQLVRTSLTRASADSLGPADPVALQSERDRQAAQRELWELRREAERLAAALGDAGRAAGRALDAAREQLPDPPPLLARAAAATQEAADAHWEDVKRVAREHEDGLQRTADVLAVAGLVAMTGAIVFPPMAAVAAGTRAAQLALVAARAAAVGGRGATWGGALANSAVVAGSPEKSVTDLWPDALAVGTLGASRALTAPTRVVRGAPSRWNIATARAADSRLGPTAGPTSPASWPSGVSRRGQDVPSIWSADAAIGPNELVMRSVRLAVDSPNAVVGTVGGLTAAGSLYRGATGQGPAPAERAGGTRAERRRGHRGRGER